MFLFLLINFSRRVYSFDWWRWNVFEATLITFFEDWESLSLPNDFSLPPEFNTWKRCTSITALVTLLILDDKEIFSFADYKRGILGLLDFTLILLTILLIFSALIVCVWNDPVRLVSFTDLFFYRVAEVGCSTGLGSNMKSCCGSLGICMYMTYFALLVSTTRAEDLKFSITKRWQGILDISDIS